MSTHNVWRYWDDYRKERPKETFEDYVARRAQQEADERNGVRIRGVLYRNEDDAYDALVQREVDGE